MDSRHWAPQYQKPTRHRKADALRRGGSWQGQAWGQPGTRDATAEIREIQARQQALVYQMGTNSTARAGADETESGPGLALQRVDAKRLQQRFPWGTG